MFLLFSDLLILYWRKTIHRHSHLPYFLEFSRTQNRKPIFHPLWEEFPSFSNQILLPEEKRNRERVTIYLSQTSIDKGENPTRIWPFLGHQQLLLVATQSCDQYFLNPRFKPIVHEASPCQKTSDINSNCVKKEVGQNWVCHSLVLEQAFTDDVNTCKNLTKKSLQYIELAKVSQRCYQGGFL